MAERSVRHRVKPITSVAFEARQAIGSRCANPMVARSDTLHDRGRIYDCSRILCYELVLTTHHLTLEWEESIYARYAGTPRVRAGTRSRSRLTARTSYRYNRRRWTF
jgi:hypothetical protein